MATFSASEAATAGFGLIRRKPLAVLGWGLFVLIFILAPICGVYAWMIPQFIDLAQQGEHASQEEMMRRMAPMQATMMACYPLIMICAIGGRAVVVSAVYRAVLEPANGAWAYLRVGAQELWVGLGLLVYGILVGTGFWVACMPVIIIVAVLALNHWTAAAVIAGVVGGIAVIAAVIWVALRLSMGAPMSFAERRFALFESWNLTKGRAGGLFGMSVIIVLLVLVIEFLFGLIAVALLWAVAMSGPFQLPDAEGASPQQVIAALAPLMAGGAVVYSLLLALLLPVVIAPWAVAYKSLAAGMVREPGVA